MSPVFELCEHCHIFKAQLEAKERRVAELEKELAEERASRLIEFTNAITQITGLRRRVEALERKNVTYH